MWQRHDIFKLKWQGVLCIWGNKDILYNWNSPLNIIQSYFMAESCKPKERTRRNSCKRGKKMKEKSTLLRQSSYRREIRISFWISNCKPSKAACSALLVSSKNSSEAADKYKIIKILYANTMLHMHTKKSKHMLLF